MAVEYEGLGEWDFKGSNTKEYTHCFHIYPAMMIPQIARRLLKLYGKRGGLLFDPYCGTGTSLVEARLFGMDAAGTDLNPTARMIAEAKTRDYDIPQLKTDIERFLEDLEENLREIDNYDSFTEPEFVTFQRLEDWFPEKTIGEICECIGRINLFQSESTKTFLTIALSECLRLTSFQRNREFKLYRIPEQERTNHYVAIFPLLQERLSRNLKGCAAFCDKVESSTSANIYGFNTVDNPGLDEIGVEPDIVVTSPPYGDSATTVAYAQFSWLTNVWLGLEDSAPGALDRELMGGSKEELTELGFEPMDEAIAAIAEESETRASEVMHFYSEYLKSLKNVASVISGGGYACYVVGNRTVGGHQLPTDKFTAWAFEQWVVRRRAFASSSGTDGWNFSHPAFTHEKTYVREIPNKRMPSRNSPTNVAGQTSSTMMGEYIVVCRKRGKVPWWVVVGVGVLLGLLSKLG